MATFLELAQATRMISGMQGTGPSSVVNQQGIEAVLVRFVKDAYTDIQNLREDWKWMEASRSFSTQAGKDTYGFLDLFGTNTPSFKKYQYDSFYITDTGGYKSYLRYLDRNTLEAMFLNDTSRDVPSVFTEDPSSASIVLKSIPSDAYLVNFRYQKAPEELTTNAQVPSLPPAFHNLILYKAIEKLSVYLGSPQIYRAYSVEAAKMMAQLMRSELPKMKRMGGRPLV
jgi:hypothetical protein